MWACSTPDYAFPAFIVRQRRQAVPVTPLPRPAAGQLRIPTRAKDPRVASVRVHRRAEPDHVAVGIDEHALVLTPFGVLREPHIASGRTPGLG
jgi:hypothetical protein